MWVRYFVGKFVVSTSCFYPSLALIFSLFFFPLRDVTDPQEAHRDFTAVWKDVGRLRKENAEWTDMLNKLNGAVVAKAG